MPALLVTNGVIVTCIALNMSPLSCDLEAQRLNEDHWEERAIFFCEEVSEDECPTTPGENRRESLELTPAKPEP